MSLSSLQSAFLTAMIIRPTRSAGAERGVPFRIHSTLRDRDKNAMSCQSILLLAEAALSAA
jgi:hypothetical protein